MMKNVINRALAAEKKVFLLLVVIVMGLSSCSKGDSNNSNEKLTAEDASSAVMEGERERLPLRIQSMPDVSDVTIDSMHLYVTVEPMEGYMYTTWESSSGKISMVVAVSNIRTSEEYEGYIEWQSDWDSAYRAFIMKGLKQEINSLRSLRIPEPPKPYSPNIEFDCESLE